MDILKDITPAHTVCFSGHRPDRLPGNGNPDTWEAQKLAALLQKQIEESIKRGKNTFCHGAMAGFDIFAAEQVIALKEKYPHIRLITIAPYSVRFFSYEKCWTSDWINRGKEIIRKHDTGISIAEHYRSGIYYERNRTLVNNSSELICFWDGKKGGTQHTHDYAKKQGLRIIKLYPCL